MGFKSRALRNAEQKLGGRPRNIETKLSRWIDKHCVDPTGVLTARNYFAQRAGISASFLHKLCRAETEPSLKTARKISEITDQVIRLSDLALKD